MIFSSGDDQNSRSLRTVAEGHFGAGFGEMTVETNHSERDAVLVDL
jgi:hypothetical protein